MNEFNDRERAFEAKFAHDAEARFKAEARRDKKLAIWAAEILGINAEDYTRELIKADLEEAGSDDVARKLAADLGNKVDEAEIRKKIAEFDAEAKNEIFNE